MTTRYTALSSKSELSNEDQSTWTSEFENIKTIKQNRLSKKKQASQKRKQNRMAKEERWN